MTRMRWHHDPMIAFDLETTGTDPETDRIVTASLLRIHPGTGHVDRHHWLVNPGVPIPTEATAIHGITTEHAQQHGCPPARALRPLAAHIGHARTEGTPLVVYNAPFDLSFLLAECARHDVQAPALGHVVDPLVIDRGVDRYRRGSRKLTSVAEHYGVPLSAEEAHGSMADALAAARVAWKLATRYPEIGDAELHDLHQRQTEWHADWADNFEQWLTNQGRAEKIPRDWPVRGTW